MGSILWLGGMLPSGLRFPQLHSFRGLPTSAGSNQLALNAAHRPLAVSPVGPLSLPLELGTDVFESQDYVVQ